MTGARAAISFDLFDTLVDLRREALPAVDLGDGPIRSTVGALWEVFRAERDLDLETFAAALAASDRAFLHARWAEGVEVRTEDRFQAFLHSVGLPADGLLHAMTEVHVGWIAKIASTPPHHRELLAELATRQPLAVCSNFSHTPTALSILEREGLLDLFEGRIVVSADVGIRKPRREIFRRVLALLGTPPKKTWHVGDQLSRDVAGGAAMGLQTVWLTRRVPDVAEAEARYDGPPPTHVVTDLRDL